MKEISFYSVSNKNCPLKKTKNVGQEKYFETKISFFFESFTYFAPKGGEAIIYWLTAFDFT